MDTDPSLRQELNRDLLPGEHVLWTGQSTGSLIAPGDYFLIPFSIVWGGGSMTWEVLALSAVVSKHFQPANLVFPLFGIPFVLLGLYLMVGRFIVKSRMRRRTLYALTDKRAMELHTGGSRSLRSIPLDRIPSLGLREERSGRGTVSFGDTAPGQAQLMNNGMEWMARQSGTMPLAFFDIRDARSVYGRIESLREPGSGRGFGF